MHDKPRSTDQQKLKASAKSVQHEITDASRSLLMLTLDPQREDAGALINYVTYSQRLKDKLTNFANLNIRVKAEPIAQATQAAPSEQAKGPSEPTQT